MLLITFVGLYEIGLGRLWSFADLDMIVLLIGWWLQIGWRNFDLFGVGWGLVWRNRVGWCVLWICCCDVSICELRVGCS